MALRHHGTTIYKRPIVFCLGYKNYIVNKVCISSVRLSNVYYKQSTYLGTMINVLYCNL